MALAFDRDGAQCFAGAASDQLASLTRVLAPLDQGQAGLRLFGVPGLSALVERGSPFSSLAERLGGRDARPVRAILFDKNGDNNWPLGWHQDRVIAVRRRVDVPGFGPWTIKQSVPHVAPPIAFLERMITLRIHIDAVDADNAPLLVAPGSHRLGLVPENRIDEGVARCGTAVCLAEAGDVWAYRTLILHASEAAARPRRRRVLQIDYSPDELPGGLAWIGLGN